MGFHKPLNKAGYFLGGMALGGGPASHDFTTKVGSSGTGKTTMLGELIKDDVIYVVVGGYPGCLLTPNGYIYPMNLTIMIHVSCTCVEKRPFDM